MMKVKFMVVALLLATGRGSAEERVEFSAGNKQEILAPAASYAIEAGNIEMLAVLAKAGWDPSLPIGRVPGDLDFLSPNALTLATMVSSEKVVRWLVVDLKMPVEARDAYLSRGIDVALEDDVFTQGTKEDVDEMNAIIRLLERDVAPQLADAIEELACNAISKFGSGPCRLKVVNGKPPEGEWLKFDAYFDKLQKLRNSKEDAIVPTVQETEEPPLKKERKPLAVTWEKTDDGSFRFSIAEAYSDWSGGVSGVIYFKHGYWLTKDKKSWDG